MRCWAKQSFGLTLGVSIPPVSPQMLSRMWFWKVFEETREELGSGDRRVVLHSWLLPFGYIKGSFKEKGVRANSGSLHGSRVMSLVVSN